jgi:hypothetical protein
MTSLTEGNHAGEFLLSEATGNRSRENVILVSGQDLPAGTVVGKITASGKYAVVSQGASDGTQTAVGVLYDNVDASAADTECVIIARDAEVIEDELLFGNESPAELVTAKTELAAVGIIVRGN